MFCFWLAQLLTVQSDAQAPGDLQGLTVRAGTLWMGPVETKIIYSGTILLCL